MRPLDFFLKHMDYSLTGFRPHSYEEINHIWNGYVHLWHENATIASDLNTSDVLMPKNVLERNSLVEYLVCAAHIGTMVISFLLLSNWYLFTQHLSIIHHSIYYVWPSVRPAELSQYWAIIRLAILHPQQSLLEAQLRSSLVETEQGTFYSWSPPHLQAPPLAGSSVKNNTDIKMDIADTQTDPECSSPGSAAASEVTLKHIW